MIDYFANIMSILRRYDNNLMMPVSQLIQEISSLNIRTGYHINTQDNNGNTPIMLYCLEHQDHITSHSYIAIQAMITDLQADVNIRNDKNEIPLNIFLHNAFSIVEVQLIKLLSSYTTLYSFNFVAKITDNNIISTMCSSPIFFKTGILQQVIEHFLYMPSLELRNFVWNLVLATMGVEEVPQLEYLISKFLSIESETLMLEPIIEQDWFDMLLEAAIYYNNDKLMSVLSRYSPDLGESSLFSAINSQERFKESFAKDLSTLMRSTIINNQFVNLATINVALDQERLMYTALQRSGRQLIQSYLSDHNINTLHEQLGFNNNIFHMIALIPDFNTEDIQRIYNTLSPEGREQYLTSKNLLKQNPLVLGLLCGNVAFLSFCHSLNILSKTTALDELGNTPLHIMARVFLNQNQIQQIFQMFALESQINAPNIIFITPLSEVIKSSNIILLRYMLEINPNILLEASNHGTTPWHYYAISQDFESTSNQNLKDVYNILQFHIHDRIYHPNLLGITPLCLAVRHFSISQLQFMLNDPENNFNFNIIDQNGNTISHILAQAFRNNAYEGYINNPILRKIVSLLIPHHEKIKANYVIKNIDGETPTDILAGGENLSAWFIQLFDEQLCNLLIQYDRYSLEDDVSLHLSLATKKLLDDLSINEMPRILRDVVYILSMDIVYGSINAWDDTIIHELISKEVISIGTERIVLYILKMLPDSLLVPIYYAPNKLGQRIGHIAVQAKKWHLVQHLLSCDINIINQVTSDIKETAIEHNSALSLFDYAILLHDSDSIKRLIDLVLMEKPSESTAFVIKTNFIDSIRAVISKLLDNTVIDGISFTDIQSHTSYFKYCAAIKIRVSVINSRFLSFGLTYYAIQNLIKGNILDNKVLPLVHNLWVVESINQLQNYLHAIQDAPRNIVAGELYSLILAVSGHASAIVIHINTNNQRHVYIQDAAQYDENLMISRVSQERYDWIVKLLKEILYISDNIHTFKITQQLQNSNCAIWTIANILLIQRGILTEATYQTMFQDIKDHAPQLVHSIQNAILEYYDKHNKLSSDEDITQQQSSRTVIPSREGTDNPTLMTNWLEDTDLRNLIINDPTYISMFDMQWLHEQYDTSRNGLSIISRGIAWEQLESSIRQFVDFISSGVTVRDTELVPTRTLIMNLNNNHWVTLVITYINNQYYAYYADSLGTSIPHEIKQVLRNGQITQIIDYRIIQQQDGYNCGLWALENARDINNIIQQYSRSDLSLNEMMKHVLNPQRNGRDNPEYFQRIRATMVDWSNYSQRLHSLQEVEIDIDLCSPSSDSSSHKVKRAAGCQEDEEKKRYRSFEKYIPQDYKISLQLFINAAYLYALQNQNTGNVHATLQCIRNIGDMINKDVGERSVREKHIIEQYYNNVQLFAIQYPKEKLFESHKDTEGIHGPILLDNGLHSLIVSYEDKRYKIYSLNYNYNMVFQTKTDVQFLDMQKFAHAFFNFFSSGQVLYNSFTLSQSLPQTAIMQLTQSQFWDTSYMTSDAEALQHQSIKVIQGIPTKVIRDFFMISGTIPEVDMIIDPNFFEKNQSKISLRIEKLHKILLSINYQESKNLLSLIKKYQIKADEQYINHITEQDTRKLFMLYSKEVTDYLNKYDSITPELLSRLSWRAFQHYLHEYSSDLQSIGSNAHEITNMLKKLHTGITDKLGHIVKHVGMNGIFFIPDIIRAINTGDTSQVKTMIGMTTGDLSINRLLTKLQKVLPQKYATVLNKLPITSPIFKALTVYSIIKLHQELSQLSSSDTRSDIIKHHLVEQYATLSLIILDYFIPEVGIPLQTVLLSEQLIYSGIAINKVNDLNIPVLEAILMDLGFENDKLNTLIEEAGLLKHNLDDIVVSFQQYSTVMHLIRIPKISDMKWKNITRDDISRNISEVLDEEHDNKNYCNGHSVNNTCTIQYDNIRLVEYCTAKTESAIKSIQCKPHFYEQSYYEAYALPINITLENIHKINYQPNMIRQAGYPYASVCDLYDNHEIFIEKIEHNNRTWTRVPQQRFTTPGACKINNNVKYMSMYFESDPEFTFSSLARQALIQFVFDPYEGDVSILLPQRWLQHIHDYNNGLIRIIINNKEYGKSLQFANISSNPTFILDDRTKNTHSEFVINHSTLPYEVRDNTNRSTIICQNKDIVYGAPYDIKIGAASLIFGYKHYLSLVLHDCTIGNALILNSGIIRMNRVSGSSQKSQIILDNLTTIFHIALHGNINIYHGNSTFTMLGTLKNNVIDLPVYRMSNYNYKIMVTNLLAVFAQCNISNIHASLNVQFRHNMIDYFWHTTKNTNNGIYITDKVSKSYIYANNTINMMNLYINNNTDQQIYHYHPAIIMNKDLILKNIYYNSSSIKNDNEFHGVIVNFYNLTIPFIKIINNPQYNIVLLFEDREMNSWHHIIPPNCNSISINNINYQIQQDRICAVYNIHTTAFLDELIVYTMQQNVVSLNNNIRRVGICFNSTFANSTILYENIYNLHHLVINDVGINSTTQHWYQSPYIYFLDQSFEYTALMGEYILNLLEQIKANSAIADIQELNTLKDALNGEYRFNNISLINKGLTYDSIATLVKSLRILRASINVPTLDLSDNKIGNNLELLFDVLPNIPGLEVLKLKNISLFGDGNHGSVFARLLDLLPKMYLKYLDMSHNHINNDGVAVMSDKLDKLCPELLRPIKINIAHNKFNKATVEFLQNMNRCNNITIIDGIYINDDITGRAARHIYSGHDMDKLSASQSVQHKHRHHHGEDHSRKATHYIDKRDIEEKHKLLDQETFDEWQGMSTDQYTQMHTEKVSEHYDKTTTENHGWFSWITNLLKFPFLPGAEAAPTTYAHCSHKESNDHILNANIKQDDSTSSCNCNSSNTIVQDMIILDSHTSYQTIPMLDNNAFDNNKYIDNSITGYVANSSNNFDSSNNTNVQITNTFDGNGCLMLSNMLIRKLYDTHYFSSNNNYVSPEQRDTITLNKLQSDMEYNLNNNCWEDMDIPKWYDAYKQELEKTKIYHQQENSSQYSDEPIEKIFADSVWLFDTVTECAYYNDNILG